MPRFLVTGELTRSMVVESSDASRAGSKAANIFFWETQDDGWKILGIQEVEDQTGNI